MLWFKKKKTTLVEGNLLNGFIDSHSHILPGVDDGVKTVDDSLRILKRYEQLGVSEVWCTPHVMEDIPNTAEKLNAVFGKLQDAYDGPVKLHLAAEYMIDSLFEERLAARDFLPHGSEGDHLLVETSYFNPPYGFEDFLAAIKAAGYHPILAHPERYAYMKPADYIALKKAGVNFQMNLGSIAGLYGEHAMKKAEWIRKKGLYSLAGSDVHSPRMLEAILASKLNYIERIV